MAKQSLNEKKIDVIERSIQTGLARLNGMRRDSDDRKDTLRLVRMLSIPGDEAQVIVPLPDVMHLAVKNKCTGIVLAHNHPSGELRPSKSDLELTKRFCLAAQMVSITVLDHLIFNGAPPFSFRRQGLL